MAGSIKGIIVEIGGDTSGLQKALSNVNKVTSSLSKELRGVNSLLKLDPKNSQLLAQKQKILNEQLIASKEHLESLKEAQQRYIDSGGDLNSAEYRNLEREIIKVENKVKQLTLETNKFYQAGQKLQEVGTNIKSVGSKISDLGSKLTKIGTTAGVAIGGIAVKSSMDFESAFTGVKKTVDGTPEQLDRIKKGIRDMAKELPSTTTEIAAVAEGAGQLGIATDDILDFTRVMIDLGNSTNLSADEASTALAKLANITGMSASHYSRLGSTIVDLGNNFATTEKDIVQMATRLAATGELAGLGVHQTLALATAMNSVGIEAEAGGSAMSKLLKKMQVAVELGGKDLEKFAKVAGVTSKEFQEEFGNDAVEALSLFIKGLNDTKRNGKSAIAILNDMGLTEVRLSNTILSLASSGDLMTRAVELSNKAWDENSALSKEASQRYATLKSRLETTKNRAKDMAITLGDKMTPTINVLLDKVNNFIEKLSNLSEEEAGNILKMGLMVVAAGPLLKILGSLTSGVGSVIKTVGMFSEAIGVMQTGVKTANSTVNGLAMVMKGLTSPVGAAIGVITGVVTVTALISKAVRDSEKATQEAFKNMGTAASDYIAGINTAQSHLSEFNRTLFVTSEEQQKLQEDMNKVQQGITNICKTASEERRAYTQKEIDQLDKYFEELRTLNQRELEIEQSISAAIAQQAQTNAETFQGSLEEYKVQSQEWIKTAEDQKENQLSLIEEQTTTEIALLNQRFGEEAEMTNEAYAKEYNDAINRKEKNIKNAEDETAKIVKKYADRYLQLSKENNGFYTKIQELHSKQEEENAKHQEKIDNINKMTWLSESDKNEKIEAENKQHNMMMKNIWKQMYDNMDKSQTEQLGVWLALISDAEMKGAELDEETQKIVNEILDSYDSMPKETREAMKNAMSPMLEEMQNKEPKLFSKATSIADGILSRLKKSFDIHSPSKETRSIFHNVMKGAELGLEDERKNLNKQVESLASDTLDNFGNYSNMGFNSNLSKNIIDSTKTIFTTPQITFNVKELTKENMEQCFNYVNRKFGSAY